MRRTCLTCGHSWLDHAEYDDDLERYVMGRCDHHSGCSCDGWTDRPRPVRVEQPTDQREWWAMRRRAQRPDSQRSEDDYGEESAP